MAKIFNIVHHDTLEMIIGSDKLSFIAHSDCTTLSQKTVLTDPDDA